MFAPAALLPGGHVRWRAESDRVLVADFDLPPERPQVHVTVDDAGGVRELSALRWGDAGGGRRDYIPCGCRISQERPFEDRTLPWRLTVSWWFGTPRERPFFEAEVLGVSVPRRPG